MIPTPVHGKLHESVYEPAEDTFILLDALEQDAEEIRELDPLICLEIGSGSGVVTTFLAELLRSGGRTGHAFLTTDLNPRALAQTNSTFALNHPSRSFSPILAIRTDLLAGLEGRLMAMGGIGVGVFNPPYVTTELGELEATQRAGEIGATWAGGRAGMQVTDLVLQMLPRILAPGGRFYLVAVSGNDPGGIAQRTNNRTEEDKLSCEIVLWRRAGREFLHVLRFERLT